MLSEETEKLIQAYQNWHLFLQKREEVSTIHVDEVASRVAAFYEKVKGIIDWREEHLLRKRAIERSLKRRIIYKKEKQEKMGESLVYELIRGGHFPNDFVPEEKTTDIQKIIDKYFYVLEKKPLPSEKKESEKEIQEWLLEIASYEVEKNLAPPLKEEAMIDFMFTLMKQKIKISNGEMTMAGITMPKITENEKNIQIYIAVQRALFKVDDSIIGYNLIEKQYPDWSKFSSHSPEVAKITVNIYSLKKKIEKALNYSLSEKFYRLCEKYDTPYLLIGDIIEEDPMQAKENLENEEMQETLIKKAYDQRKKKLKTTIKRAAIYTTLSVFITKIALALLVEVPLDKFITGDFNYASLGINILFPPFLMFLLVATVKSPKKENFQRAVMEVIKIISITERKDVYQIKIPKKKNKVLDSIIFIVYFLTFILSFGLIIWFLRKINFSSLSVIIFLFFLSIISFLGIKIRQRGKELNIEKERETFRVTLWDFFTLPILSLGKWLFRKWAKMNIALILAALIDMPFLTFVEFLEQWRYFLKEKKERMH